MLTFSADNARYLLVRLSLRKRDKWHRLSSLNYHSEMGDDKHIVSAIHELTGTPEPINKEPTRTGAGTTETRVVIDLTLDDDDSDSPVPREPQTDSPNTGTESHPTIDLSIDDDLLNDPPDDDLTDLAIDESKMSLLELLECLTVDELKNLARRLKIRRTDNVRIMPLLTMRLDPNVCPSVRRSSLLSSSFHLRNA
jgi:Fanconi-associated nuclease 1